MPVKSRTESTSRSPNRTTAKARLTETLENLAGPNGRNRQSHNVTVAELCRVANVSRNSLYRYHSDILKTLRRYQCRRPSAANSKARTAAELRRVENVVLHERISQLAALVDHYHAAYRQSAALLERRERELSELRRKLDLKPTLVRS